jgi:hypothetical protein
MSFEGLSGWAVGRIRDYNEWHAVQSDRYPDWKPIKNRNGVRERLLDGTLSTKCRSLGPATLRELCEWVGLNYEEIRVLNFRQPKPPKPARLDNSDLDQITFLLGYASGAMLRDARTPVEEKSADEVITHVRAKLIPKLNALRKAKS